MATNATASFTIPIQSWDSGWAWLKAHPLLTLLAVVVTQLYLTKRRQGLKDIPGPWLASFSNVWKLRAVWKQNMHRENLRAHEDYGDIVRIGPNHVSLADPKSLRAIYGVQNVFSKSAFYPLAEAIYRGRFLPTLFTTTSNDYHMRLKRGSVKAFSMDTVAGLEPYVDKCVGLLLQRLREVSDNGKVPINPVSWMHYFAFDVLGQVNFSKDLGFLDKGRDLDGIIAAIGGLLVYVSLFSLAQVEERLKTPVERRDILNQLLASHKADPDSLTLDEIIAITTTNVIAGSDTTAVSLSSVIYHLSKFPEKKKKLEDEIASAQREGRASNPITYAEAIKLPYLSAVINEAMRMHPATGFILERVVPKGGVMLHDVHLNEGTVVGVNAWVIHRNKAVFGEDVHTFRPERWIEGDEERIKEMKRNQFSVSRESLAHVPNATTIHFG
ncbi:pisatin demethylase [Colletotrichum tofieldiae]|nr:pisatin demethylase [Colletotrichum tofieldiae]GKT78564.1 pisatin demethylase [Colletotrichum tofieldiae]